MKRLGTQWWRKLNLFKMTNIKQNIEELAETITGEFNGVTFDYVNIYYLAPDVDDQTGKFKDSFVKYYTKEQSKKNLRSFRKALESKEKKI